MTNRSGNGVHAVHVAERVGVNHRIHVTDSTIAAEALKAHEYDFRNENISKNWAGAYEIPATAEGRLIKELVPHQSPTGMQGFFYNLRRMQFTDPLV